MSDTVIRVENLGKKYIIGHQKQERYLTLRDAIAQTARSVGQRFLPSQHKKQFQYQEEFWAHKDASFEITREEKTYVLFRRYIKKFMFPKIKSLKF